MDDRRAVDKALNAMIVAAQERRVYGIGIVLIEAPTGVPYCLATCEVGSFADPTISRNYRNETVKRILEMRKTHLPSGTSDRTPTFQGGFLFLLSNGTVFYVAFTGSGLVERIDVEIAKSGVDAIKNTCIGLATCGQFSRELRQLVN